MAPLRCTRRFADLRGDRGDGGEAWPQSVRQRRQCGCHPGQASARVHTRVRLCTALPGQLPQKPDETIRFIENEVRINLLGFMNTHIAAARQMVKQGTGGRILGAGSIASYRTAGQSLLVFLRFCAAQYPIVIPATL